MTEHLTTTNTQRRKWIRILQERAERLEHSAAIRENSFWMTDEAHAIRKALWYVQWNINLETGEIRAIPEPEEAA